MPLYHDEYDGPSDVEIGIEVAGYSGPQLTPEEHAAAQQIARNTGQSVQVMDVKAEAGREKEAGQ